mmetsp:Transcript_23754/g.70238  ORF Transcript_23754/g.70238 Transcript_23754/m.70238 type:complete len:207 (-) Transcript_23754:858-1478(-)
MSKATNSLCRATGMGHDPKIDERSCHCIFIGVKCSIITMHLSSLSPVNVHRFYRGIGPCYNQWKIGRVSCCRGDGGMFLLLHLVLNKVGTPGTVCHEIFNRLGRVACKVDRTRLGHHTQHASHSIVCHIMDRAPSSHIGHFDPPTLLVAMGVAQLNGAVKTCRELCSKMCCSIVTRSEAVPFRNGRDGLREGRTGVKHPPKDPRKR